MSPLRISLFLACPVAAGAVLGACFGGLIGAIAPGYYRAVFRSQLGEELNPVQLGIGLGVGQGAGAGFVLGLVALGVFAWRAAKQEPSAAEGLSDSNSGKQIRSPGTRSVFGFRRVAMLAGFGILLLFVSFVSFVAGGITSQLDLYNRRAEHGTRLVKERLNLASHAAAFRRIEYYRTSDGYVSLTGAVRTKADFDPLYHELQDLFGSERATDLSAGVAVSAPAARKTSQNRTAQNLPPQTDIDRPE
jgi:hypothetical protein